MISKFIIPPACEKVAFKVENKTKDYF